VYHDSGRIRAGTGFEPFATSKALKVGFRVSFQTDRPSAVARTAIGKRRAGDFSSRKIQVAGHHGRAPGKGLREYVATAGDDKYVHFEHRVAMGSAYRSRAPRYRSRKCFPDEVVSQLEMSHKRPLRRRTSSR